MMQGGNARRHLVVEKHRDPAAEPGLYLVREVEVGAVALCIGGARRIPELTGTDEQTVCRHRDRHVAAHEVFLHVLGPTTDGRLLDRVDVNAVDVKLCQRACRLDEIGVISQQRTADGTEVHIDISDVAILDDGLVIREVGQRHVVTKGFLLLFLRHGERQHDGVPLSAHDGTHHTDIGIGGCRRECCRRFVEYHADFGGLGDGNVERGIV